MARKTINKDVEADVLVESRRRCCICFGLNRDLEVKTGQIAHLDQNNTNNSYDNLAFLCFDHHDQYDSKAYLDAENRPTYHRIICGYYF